MSGRTLQIPSPLAPAPATHRATAARPTGTDGITYFAGLDGIRAISVVAVLLYHGGVSWAHGGYLGVEVFFVISGFLITSLLLAEHRAKAHIDLPRFWMRRARRLLPAMFAVVLATMLVTTAVPYLRDSMASLRGDAVSSILYVTNWNFILAQKSYFEFSGRPPLLQHLWSLAVEEQFYLVWPILFATGMRLFSRKNLRWVVGAGIVASATAMAVMYDPNLDASRNRVYLGTDTRASGLLIGCLLAFVWVPGSIRKDRAGQHAGLLLDVVGASALGGIIWMLHDTSEFSTFLYRGGFIVLSLLTAALIAAVVHPSAHVGRVLGLGPLRWVGLRSYGIYLWHWPVFQLTRPQLDVPFDGAPLFGLRIAISFVLAALSYRFLEMPIRQGALGRAWKALRTATGDDHIRLRQRWLAGIGSLALVLGVVIGFSVTAEPKAPELLVAASITGGTGAAAAIDPAQFALLGTDPNAGPDPFANRSTSPSTATTASTSSIATPGSDPAPTDPTSITSAPTSPGASTLPRLAPALPGLKIALLGDSVMLGASPAVKALLGDKAVVSAQKSRQVSDGIGILQTWQQAGWLGDAEIVIDLGNNGTFFDEQFDRIMTILDKSPRVVFINVRVPRPWQDSVNDTLKRGVERHPANTVLIDWYAFSEGKPEWFYDGMHLKPDAATQYAALIASAL